jgi:hypothetical protein
MDLKSFLPSDKVPLKEEYWSLIIEPEWVQAGIWSVEGGKTKVTAVSHPSAWQEDSELLTSCDAALSSAIQSLPEDSPEPTKTVFGVTASWVIDGEIKHEYLEKIKAICSKLELIPVGFVVLQEAISHYVKSEEGSPLSGIVVFLGANNIEVSIFNNGNQVGNMVVARSVSVIDDIAEGLSRFSQDTPFPSRIILYDGREGELDDEKQSIVNADWQGYEKIQFLHAPKVETIDPERKVLAVCLAGGLEMAMTDGVMLVSHNNTTPETEEIMNKEEVENITPAEAPDLGFYVNEDVAKNQNVNPEPMNEALKRPQPLPQEETLVPGIEGRSGLVDRIKGKLSGIRKLLPSFKTRMPQRTPTTKLFSGGSGGPKKIIITGVIGFIIFFAVGMACWWYFPKAEIKIYVSPQNIEETTLIFVDTNTKSIDVEGKVIPGEVVTRRESGEKEKKVTGSKIIGDKAKGQVKLFRSGTEMKLNAGTIITSSGGLAFTLDNEAKLASGSASTPGTVVVPVTASKIGTESNLPSGTSFKIDNYPTSDIEAKSEAAFSGGTSREISAVSDEDQKELEEGLSIELKDKVQADIESSLGEDKILIAKSIVTKVKEQTFSAKVGDEATNIKLSQVVEATALVVSKSDLFSFGKEILAPRISKDYVLRDSKLIPEFEYIGESDGKYELNLTLKALLLPALNTDEIKNNILGKYRSLAVSYITGLSSVSGVEINIHPGLPGKLATIPRILKNINILVDSK